MAFLKGSRRRWLLQGGIERFRATAKGTIIKIFSTYGSLNRKEWSKVRCERAMPCLCDLGAGGANVQVWSGKYSGKYSGFSGLVLAIPFYSGIFRARIFTPPPCKGVLIHSGKNPSLGLTWGLTKIKRVTFPSKRPVGIAPANFPSACGARTHTTPRGWGVVS